MKIYQTAVQLDSFDNRFYQSYWDSDIEEPLMNRDQLEYMIKKEFPDIIKEGLRVDSLTMKLWNNDTLEIQNNGESLYIKPERLNQRTVWNLGALKWNRVSDYTSKDFEVL